jgi:diguanylate cyclase (GGDEF)-like protein
VIRLNPGSRASDHPSVTPRTQPPSSAGPPNAGRTPGRGRDRGAPATPELPTPTLPGLDVLAELDHDVDTTTYRVRRYGGEYKLTLFDPDRPDQAELVRSLQRTATRLTAIGHPRLPAVHQVGVADNRPYLVTDLVTGRPLADLIAGEALPVSQAIRFVLDVVDPLTAMHRRGLVHAGLTARTLIVQDDGSARLLDAGPGRHRADGETRAGTLGYRAPEQSGALDRPVDNRTDLFSLGVVLFECLTGTLPYLAADAEDLARRHTAGSATDPRTVATDLPESVALVVARLLAVDPDQRYQSGAELAADLRLLLGEPQPDGLFESDTLFGREHELAVISELWEQVRRGHGRGCALRGPTGVGKTRLSEEIVRIAHRDGAPVLVLACAEDDAEPLAPLRRAVQTLVQDAETLPLTRRNELHDWIRAAAGESAPLLAGLGPGMADLLGTHGLPDADRQNQFAAAVARFVLDLARQAGGLLLLTDDVGLVDPSTLRVMSHLAADLADAPLLSIGSFRSDQQQLSPADPLVQALVAATDIDLVLEPLSAAAVNDLLGDRLPGIDLESSLARALREHGGGNPFVLLEHLRLIVEAGSVRPHWGSWMLDEEDRDRPVEPLALARAALIELAPETRRILSVAAVIGPRFRPADVLAVVNQDESPFEPGPTYPALADAAAGQLIELAGSGDYRFCAERTREALLDDLDPDHRARLHQAVGEVLEARGDENTEVFRIARHFLLGTPSSATDRAFPICLAAGRAALAAHAPGAAARFLEHAAELRAGDARLLYRLGMALHRDGQYGPARRRLEEALAVEKDGLRRGRILLQLTDVHRATQNTRKAIHAVDWGLAELDAARADGPVRRLVAGLWAGLVAAVIMATGWGFGTVRHRWRERQDLLAALYLAGSRLSTVDLRPVEVLLFRMHAARAAARLGVGTQYSLSCAATGSAAAQFGFARLQRRSLARAEQGAAETADPQLIAQIAWYAGAADYLARVDNGERWIRCLTDQGQWLDNEQYSDAVAALCWDAAVQGRDDDALRWSENGRARGSFGGAGELTALLTVPSVGLTAAGRPAAANAELRRVRALLEDHGGRGLQANLTLAELYALIEQDHLGEHFDAVAERFFAFKLSRRGLLRPYRTFYLLYAQGRLAQCRAAQYALAQRPATVAPISVEDRLEAAATAVRQLRSMANTPLLTAAYQQCRAELLMLEGRPKQALAVLSRLKPQREDAPLLGYEIARTTARALLSTGYPADARRQVLSALTLAEDHGWTGRRNRLAAEFGLRATSTAAPLVQVRAPAPTARVEVTAEPPPAPSPEPLPAGLAERGSALHAFAQELTARAAGRELDLASTLRDSLTEMSASTDPAEVLRRLVIAAERMLTGERAWLIRPAPRTLAGAGPLAQVLFADLPASGTVCDLVFDPDLRTLITAGLPVIGDQESIVPPQFRRLLAEAASWSVLPLISDGTPIGVLVLASSQTDTYSPTVLAVAGTLVAQGMTAHAKATLVARLQELAGTDELTGVRSLRQVIELATRDLHGARRNSRPLVVMVVDIDHLGRINDLHGWATGDDVIRQVANRLGQVIRGTDLLGRYREDEFIVVLSQGRDQEDGIGDGGLEVAERLLTAVSRAPLQTRSGALPITVTIGLTLMTDEDTEMTSLTTRAEVPLQAAKLNGRNQVRGV